MLVHLKTHAQQRRLHNRLGASFEGNEGVSKAVKGGAMKKGGNRLEKLGNLKFRRKSK